MDTGDKIIIGLLVGFFAVLVAIVGFFGYIAWKVAKGTNDQLCAMKNQYKGIPFIGSRIEAMIPTFNCPDCPSGQLLIGGKCQTPPKCESNKEYNIDTGKCECPGDRKWDTELKICVPSTPFPADWRPGDGLSYVASQFNEVADTELDKILGPNRPHVFGGDGSGPWYPGSLLTKLPCTFAELSDAKLDKIFGTTRPHAFDCGCNIVGVDTNIGDGSVSSADANLPPAVLPRWAIGYAQEFLDKTFGATRPRVFATAKTSSTCPGGSEWNSQAQKCQCPPGKSWLVDQQKCVDWNTNPCAANEKLRFLGNDSCLMTCSVYCHDGEYYDANTKTCKSITPDNPCETLHCGPNATCNRLASDSTRAECRCNPGYTLRGDQGCVSDTPVGDCSCGAGEFLNVARDGSVGCMRCCDGLLTKNLDNTCANKAVFISGRGYRPIGCDNGTCPSSTTNSSIFQK